MDMNLAMRSGQGVDLPYFIEWRPMLWTPAVNWLLGNKERFKGKRVLDLGCRYGRMSSLFGLLGAHVLGVEIERVSLDRAREEADRWKVSDKVSFTHYDGNPLHIDGHDYDFIFTKSVLVVVPKLDEFLNSLSKKLASGGEIMMAENISGGTALNAVRKLIIHRDWGFKDHFHGVNDHFILAVRNAFTIMERRNYYGLVAAIRATL